MTTLYLYDDAAARRLEPFALTRPAGELRAGALLIRERWERLLGVRAAGSITSRHLEGFEESGAAPVADFSPEGGHIVANARFAPALTSPKAEYDAVRAGPTCWVSSGRVVAVRLAGTPADMRDGAVALDDIEPAHGETREIDGWWIDETWDLVRLLPEMLASDIPRLASELDCAAPEGAIVLGTAGVHVERGAEVEPLVVFDTTAGPVLVREGVHVAAFTRLVGPCAIGPRTMVNGGKVAVCSVGEDCRVHGEVSNTIFLGHANKAHDGFVGHSYLGRWANLGAETVTSNLKNTYGPVALWTRDGVRDTGMQFLGTFFGDHAKTAVGTRLMTGTVVGAGANVFGPGLAPKVVPPFAWGNDGPSGGYAIDRFLAMAERAMARRKVALGEGGRRMLTAAHAARWEADA